MNDPMRAWITSTATGEPYLLVRLNRGGILPSLATTPRPFAGPISQAASETTPPIVINTAIGAIAPGILSAVKKYSIACITPAARLSWSAGMTKAIASVAITVQKNIITADIAIALGKSVLGLRVSSA